MITTDNLQRIYVQVALGTPKSRSPFPLTKEMSEMWGKISDEVPKIKASGGTWAGFELDVPDIEVPRKIT
jgi:hypothetical protein